MLSSTVYDGVTSRLNWLRDLPFAVRLDFTETRSIDPNEIETFSGTATSTPKRTTLSRLIAPTTTEGNFCSVYLRHPPSSKWYALFKIFLIRMKVFCE
jgi:hypothetical protein